MADTNSKTEVQAWQKFNKLVSGAFPMKETAMRLTLAFVIAPVYVSLAVPEWTAAQDLPTQGARCACSGDCSA